MLSWPASSLLSCISYPASPEAPAVISVRVLSLLLTAFVQYVSLLYILYRPPSLRHAFALSRVSPCTCLLRAVISFLLYSNLVNLSTPIPEIILFLSLRLRKTEHFFIVVYKSRKSKGLCCSSFFFTVDSRHPEEELLTLL